jgi:hypothetical protein
LHRRADRDATGLTGLQVRSIKKEHIATTCLPPPLRRLKHQAVGLRRLVCWFGRRSGRSPAPSAAAGIVGGKETANFWDIEKPKFALAQGPAWLKIDPATGLLRARSTAGKVDVAVTVTIDQEVRKLDGTLGWGIVKVLSTSTERVGSATRRFSIEVGR